MAEFTPREQALLRAALLGWIQSGCSVNYFESPPEGGVADEDLEELLRKLGTTPETLKQIRRLGLLE